MDDGFISADSKEGKELTHYYEFDRNSRGAYLIQSNWIELDLNDIIAKHFCHDEKTKSELLSSLVINEISFSNKIKIFAKLMKLHYPELVKKYPHLINELEQIRNRRNLFAHSVVDLREDIIKKKQYDRIHLNFLKDGVEKTIVITKNDIDEMLTQASDVTLLLDTKLKPYIEEHSKTKF